MAEVVIWRCRHGHVMGQVRKNGRGASQLYLYRHAVAADESPAEVDVMAVVQGSVVDIRCDICGDLRTWLPGQAEWDRLMRQYQGREELKGIATPGNASGLAMTNVDVGGAK